MSDETTTSEAPATETPAAREVPAQETDWKSEARKWEERSKANKGELDKLTEQFTAAEAARTELEKRVQEFEAKEARATLVAKVAEDTGVPAEVLRGDTEDDLKAHAETLKALIKPSGPIVPGQEQIPGKVTADPVREFARNLFEKAKAE